MDENLFIFELYNDLPYAQNNKKLSSLLDEWKERTKQYNLSLLTEKALKNVDEYLCLLETSWKTYLKGFEYIDSIYPFIKKKRFFYPRKTKTLIRFLNSFTRLNEIVYSLGFIEKDVAEKLAEKHEIDIRNINPSLPSAYLYLNELSTELFKKHLDTNLINNISYIRTRIINDPFVRRLFNSYGFGKIENFVYFLQKFKKLYSPEETKKHYEIKNMSDSPLSRFGIVKIIQKILSYDHRWELEWRFLDIVKLDLPFYFRLSEILNSNLTINDIEKKLRTLYSLQNEEFKYKILFFNQSGPTCGVACLLNMINSLSFEKIKISRSLENMIFKEITYPGTVNNLPTCLVKTAQNYGLPSYFIIDWERYTENFLTNPKFKNDPRVLKLLECKKEIKTIPKKTLQPEEIVDLLQSGYMVAMVSEINRKSEQNTRKELEKEPEEVLHYRLFYGYKKTPNEYQFYIFDPLLGPFITSEIERYIKNRYGMWGVAVGAADIPLIESLEKEYLVAVENLISEFDKFYRSDTK